MLEIRTFNTTDIPRIPLRKLQRVAESVFKGEGIEEASLNIIVVDDQAIHELNKRFLRHDYPTDVLTFCLEEDTIEGEVYICAETARRQANEYGVSLTNEMMRLAAHGTLHLVGYNDATEQQRETMTRLENKYIQLK